MDASDYKKYEPFWGSWYITKKIGEGGYGTVFEVESNENGARRKAALKIITVPKSESDLNAIIMQMSGREGARGYYKDLVNNMFGEIKLMAQLRGSRSIVDYEAHQVMNHSDGIGWDIFIRMELLTPLDKWLQSTDLRTRSVVKLGMDICEALELCRQNKIIHRDIKPANIFVTNTGSFKLGDFGIARTVEKSKGASTFIGTIDYMAPEIVRGEKYGSSVDIYSLGVVMYQLLNDSRLPFMPPFPQNPGYSDKEKAHVMRMKGAKMPRPRRAQGRLGDIVLKACAFRPQDRYRTPAEMRADLEAVLLTVEDEELKPQETPAAARSAGSSSASGSTKRASSARASGARNSVKSSGRLSSRSSSGARAQSGSGQQKKKSAAPVIACAAAACVLVLAVVIGVMVSSHTSASGSAKVSTVTAASSQNAGMAISEIKINEQNFPDENFRAFVSENYDTDIDGWLSGTELAGVTSMDVSDKNIKSLAGIAHFGALQYLDCTGNQIKSLDVSQNKLLTFDNLRCDKSTKIIWGEAQK